MERFVRHGAWMASVALVLFGSVSAAPADDAAPPPADEETVTAPAAPEAPEDEYYQLMRVFVDTFEQIDRTSQGRRSRRTCRSGRARDALPARPVLRLHQP